MSFAIDRTIGISPTYNTAAGAMSKFPNTSTQKFNNIRYNNNQTYKAMKS
jgi:hypothetical protein